MLSPSGPGLILVGRLFITLSGSSLVMILLKFLMSSWFNFGSFTESRNYLFLLDFPT